MENPIREAIEGKLDARETPGRTKKIQKRAGKRNSRLGRKPRHPTGVIAKAEGPLRAAAGRANAVLRRRLSAFLDGDGRVIDQAEARRIRRLLSVELGGTSKSQAGQIAEAIFKATDQFNYRDVARSIGIRVLEFEGEVGAAWRKEQVAKITGLTSEGAERISRHLAEIGERGMRVETLRKRLEETEEMGYRRARLVARDSVLSLNARLTEERHKAAGVTEYEWLAMSGGSTRKNHADLDGRRFRYDSPPMGGGTGPNDRGNPGDGIGCRCQAIPIVPEFEE